MLLQPVRDLSVAKVVGPEAVTAAQATGWTEGGTAAADAQMPKRGS